MWEVRAGKINNDYVTKETRRAIRNLKQKDYTAMFKRVLKDTK